MMRESWGAQSGKNQLHQVLGDAVSETERVCSTSKPNVVSETEREGSTLGAQEREKSAEMIVTVECLNGKGMVGGERR